MKFSLKAEQNALRPLIAKVVFVILSTGFGFNLPTGQLREDAFQWRRMLIWPLKVENQPLCLRQTKPEAPWLKMAKKKYAESKI